MDPHHFGKPDLDPHQSEKPDPAADQHASKSDPDRSALKSNFYGSAGLKWSHGASWTPAKEAWRLKMENGAVAGGAIRVSRPVHGRRFALRRSGASSGSASQWEEIRINVMRFRNTAPTCAYMEPVLKKIVSSCQVSVILVYSLKALEAFYVFEMYLCGYWSMLIPWVGCTRMKTERGRSRPWEMGSTLFFSLPICSPSPVNVANWPKNRPQNSNVAKI